MPKNMPKYFFKKDKKIVDIEKYFGIIVTAVAKSNKTYGLLAQLVEQLTLNQWV